MPELSCVNCGSNYYKVPCLVAKSRFCSRDCQRAFHGWNNTPNASCGGCGKEMHVKPSKLAKMVHQPCCSRSCLANFRSGKYTGNKNPNFKARVLNHDGYRLSAPYASGFPSHIKESLLHKAVAARALGVSKIKGFHVHHRDCDVLNNQPENLAVLGSSDHKWIHKQFGNATLWALMKGKLTDVEMSKWSDNPTRALRVLRICVEDQVAEDIGKIDEGVLSPID